MKSDFINLCLNDQYECEMNENIFKMNNINFITGVYGKNTSMNQTEDLKQNNIQRFCCSYKNDLLIGMSVIEVHKILYKQFGVNKKYAEIGLLDYCVQMNVLIDDKKIRVYKLIDENLSQNE